jgi:acyl-coenzyme A thioesterase PaaI-like protein
VDDIEFILERMREYQRAPRQPTSAWMAKRELAAQLRRLNNLICSTAAPEEHIRELAAALKEHADHFEAEDVTPDGLDPNVRVVHEGMRDFTDRSPIVGLANPISPPATFEMDVDARLVRGEVTFGRSMGGAPGRVHGGMVAALLDEALGRACMFAGTPAMTAEFTTHYLGPTPVETPLRIEARLDGVEDRRIHTSGELYDGDTSIVEADGLFIGVDTDSFRAFFYDLTRSD